NPVVHHRGYRVARVLNDTHGEIHKPGVAVLKPLTPRIMRVSDQMQPDTQVETLSRSPHGVEVGMTETSAVDRCGGYKERPPAQASHPFHFAYGHLRI